MSHKILLIILDVYSLLPNMLFTNRLRDVKFETFEFVPSSWIQNSEELIVDVTTPALEVSKWNDRAR